MNYQPEDVAALLVLAKHDVVLSARALAERAGIDESIVVKIESGLSAAHVSHDVVSALLIAAELRPAVPLGFSASNIRQLADNLGRDRMKVFGSPVHGLDTPTSEVDFLGSMSEGTSSFAKAGFQSEAEKLLKFPVDVMLEATNSPIGDRARAEAVPL